MNMLKIAKREGFSSIEEYISANIETLDEEDRKIFNALKDMSRMMRKING